MGLVGDFAKAILILTVGCWILLVLEFALIGQTILALILLLSLPILSSLLILEYGESKRKEIATRWTFAVLAVVSFAIFVWMQFASIHSKDFLELVFSSFFFLGVATILATSIYRGSKITQKALGVGVSIILVIGTILVTNSLTLNPRGGGDVSTIFTMEEFDLGMQGHKVDDQWEYRAQYSEVIHKPNYAASEIRLDTYVGQGAYLGFLLVTPANVNGTCYFSFALRPYESDYYPLLTEEAVFTDSPYQIFEVNVERWWGRNFLSAENLPEVKFEGYEIEFTFQLILTGAETEPSVLNFTVHPELTVYIHEEITISTFQNNLSIALCGVFIGTNVLVPGTSIFHLISRRRKNKEIEKQE
jgi:hypothetical protein